MGFIHPGKKSFLVVFPQKLPNGKPCIRFSEFLVTSSFSSKTGIVYPGKILTVLTENGQNQLSFAYFLKPSKPSMPRDLRFTTCLMCEQLNQGQRLLFNYIITYVQLRRWAENNNRECPEPFYIYLSGPGGVGKKHLIKVIAEYCRRNLKWPGQNANQPAIMLTASTGKAAAQIHGTTVHSAFALPVKQKFQRNEKKLQLLNTKFKYLTLVVLDEISMLDNQTFQHLDRQLQLIMENYSDLGGVSFLISGDFLQLPPAGGYPVYKLSQNADYANLAGCLWKRLFYIYEFTEIVRQSGDPEFASMLSRIREAKHTENDMY